MAKNPIGQTDNVQTNQQKTEVVTIGSGATSCTASCLSLYQKLEQFRAHSSVDKNNNGPTVLRPFSKIL